MDFKNRLKKFGISLPKSKSGFLVIVGIVGLLLVLLSSVSDKATKKTSNVLTTGILNSVESSSQYVSQMEARLENVISDMLGGTSVNVMITLESGSRYIYANEIKTDTGVKDDQNSQKTEQSDSNQETYVIMKNSDGAEQPLLITEIMPTVRGVVVVCDSGQTERVSSAVRAAVMSALDIENEKICIIGRY